MARPTALLLLLVLGAAAGESSPSTPEQVLSSASDGAADSASDSAWNSAIAAALRANEEAVLATDPSVDSVFPPEPACPDYSTYSYAPHFPKTGGKYNLPFQRPTLGCRKFNLSEVEDTLASMKKVVKDPDLFRLFENCFPNTLDTAITWKGYANNSDDSFYEEEV